MSRVGKKPIVLPEKVKVSVKDRTVTVQGPLGSLDRTLHPHIAVTVEGKSVSVLRKDDSRAARAMHGLFRALIQNMMKGVSEGYTKELELVGVGYRAELKGKALNLSLGFSHPIEFPIPAGIAIDAKQTKITVSGIDNQLVGEVAAKIRRYRPPEPYKAKGVRYVGEFIRRKAGKTAASASGTK